MADSDQKINKWGLGLEYADSTKYKMEKGDHISKYEIWEEIKKAFEDYWSPKY